MFQTNKQIKSLEPELKQIQFNRWVLYVYKDHVRFKNEYNVCA